MIRLIDLLKEFGTATNAGLGSPNIKLVFSDESKGLNDSRKVKEILRVLERNLKIIRPTYDISISDVMNSFKYFPATDKLIGNYPKNIFFNEKARRARNMAVNIKNCRFDDELLKISKTLDVKRKTI